MQDTHVEASVERSARRAAVANHEGLSRVARPARLERALHQPVLVVDGEPEGQRLARELADLVPGVELHETARSALQRVRDLGEHPLAAVVELRLPDGWGMPILEETLRQSPASAVVVLTAYGSIASTKRALQMGARDYLCKPASAAEIARLLLAGPMTDEPKALEIEHPSLDRAIWEYINFVLAEAGSIAGAARRMKIDRRSLRRMLQKHPPER